MNVAGKLGRMLGSAHRIETSRPRRHVRVSAGGQILAESDQAVLLREGRLPERWYLPREDVHAELLDSDTHTTCPFKGEASYHSLRLSDGEVLEDAVWYYPEPLPAVSEIAGRLSFYGERVEIEVD